MRSIMFAAVLLSGSALAAVPPLPEAAGDWLLSHEVTLEADALAYWHFALSHHWVLTEGKTTYAVVASDAAAPQMQALRSSCRRALGLPLRARIEQELIQRHWIAQADHSWPLTALVYSVQQLSYQIWPQAPQLIACRAKVSEPDHSDNLKQSALAYGHYYLRTGQEAALKPLLVALIRQPDTAQDAAALITLQLSRQQPQAALTYFNRHVNISTLTMPEIRLDLAQWLRSQDKPAQASTLLSDCKIQPCQTLLEQIRLEQLEADASSVDDLSSYLR